MATAKTSNKEPADVRTGLVLEGGAMRGLFTCGVLDVMLEHRIYVDGLIGVSAGAAFGCNYVSRQIGRSIRYNKRYARDRRFCSLWSLLTTGNLFNARFCYHEMPARHDVFDKQAFDSSSTEFWVVATDVDSGEVVYKRLERADDETYEWIRASASLPLVSRVVEVGGRRLLDGGMSDSMPLEAFSKMGFSRNVVVLTRPAGYRKSAPSHPRLLRLLLRDKPAIAQAMLHRYEVYNAQLRYVAERELAGDTLVFRPDPPLAIGHVCHDAQLMQATYDQGRRQAEQRLDEVRDFLNVKKSSPQGG